MASVTLTQAQNPTKLTRKEVNPNQTAGQTQLGVSVPEKG